MSGTVRVAVVGLMLVGGGVNLAGHHAFTAEFDRNKPIEKVGTVSKVEWVNPHSWLWVDVKDADGKVVAWSFELGSPTSLLRRGWKTDDSKPGTPVTVTVYQDRSGLPVANASIVKLPDGRDLFNSGVVDAPK